MIDSKLINEIRSDLRKQKEVAEVDSFFNKHHITSFNDKIEALKIAMGFSESYDLLKKTCTDEDRYLDELDLFMCREWELFLGAN